jgi:hypothetical protein
MLVVFWLFVLEQSVNLANWLSVTVFRVEPAHYDRWIPAHEPVVSSLFGWYRARYDAAMLEGLDPEAVRMVVLGPLPDVSPWWGHWAYILIGLLLVLITCRSFRRFHGY